MTKDRKFKNEVRALMAATGRKYTECRREILEERERKRESDELLQHLQP